MNFPRVTIRSKLLGDWCQFGGHWSELKKKVFESTIFNFTFPQVIMIFVKLKWFNSLS